MWNRKTRQGTAGLRQLRTIATVSFCVMLLAGECLTPQRLHAQTGNTPAADTAKDPAHWIWTGQQAQQQVPQGTVYFRRAFELSDLKFAELVIAADDEFRVYVNGRLAVSGDGFLRMTKTELTSFLQEGTNLVAVQVTNQEGNTAALGSALRFQITDDARWHWLATDSTWKVSTERALGWNLTSFDDSAWESAQTLGAIGSTMPWDETRINNMQASPSTPSSSSVAQTQNASQQLTPSIPAPTNTENTKQFRTPDRIEVQPLLDESIGSIIAMEFNEFGQLILSQERGGLLLADFSQAAEGNISIQKYSDSVKAIQGILPLNGDVYVTGIGSQGLGLYRLYGADEKGVLQSADLILGFQGPPGEHGPHGLVLGNDGMIYVTVGNASGLVDQADSTSPIINFYEGDIIPRLEDPGGHAAGVKAPGGLIVRVSLDGQRKEIVASGLRNAYDLILSQQGEMFFHDSDMESDIGAPWYRPTQIYHLSTGAEYGWRSGSAKFAYDLIDNLPGIGDTGRGSPSGGTVYDHRMLPKKYRGALFLGDWSEGRILAVHLSPEDSTYRTEIEEFLSASPLPVTDLSVGPDGGLYFSTGGRGTAGGVYRVVWLDADKQSLLDPNDPIRQLIDSPQPQSAWARQRLAVLQSEMGDKWQATLQGVLRETKNKIAYRLKALNTLLLFGPLPSEEELLALAKDKEPQIRRRVLTTLKQRSGDSITQQILQSLKDEDASVRSLACEALIYRGVHPSYEELQPLLKSSSRSEVNIARRLLERIPTDQWKEQAMAETTDLRVFLESSVALLIAEPSLRNSYDVLARITHILDGYLSDPDFYDVLRVVQLALDQGDVDPQKIPLFTQKIANEFPTASGKLNRELSRILGYLQTQEASSRLVEYLESGDSDADKFQVLTHMRNLLLELNSEDRIQILAFLERLQQNSQEGNMRLYIKQVARPLIDQVEVSDFDKILARGSEFPATSLAIFYRLPPQLPEEQLQSIMRLDRDLKDREDVAAMEARLGSLAMLAQSGDEKAMSYLREVWRTEPGRRNDVVLGLAQQPDGENWPYLVSSLETLNDDTADEVLKQLKNVNRRPKDPNYYRHVILVGHRLRAEGAQAADQLLRHWTNGKFVPQSADWRDVIQEWATWFNETYDEQPIIQFEDLVTEGSYSVDHLLTYIEQSTHAPNRQRGKELFESAQCSSCHRFQHQGEMLGPDLTTLASRFSKRETLRSILHPSDIIPDRYQAQKVLTIDGRQISGLTTTTERGIVVLQGTGEKVTILKMKLRKSSPNPYPRCPMACSTSLRQMRSAI